MNWPTDVEGEVIFLPTEAGGRKGPAFSGYRPQFFYDSQDWDAIQFYPDVQQANPGDTVRTYFAFLSPQMHVGKIVAGKMFLIREGSRVVGYGRITKVIDLEKSAKRALDREKPLDPSV
ncbi:MAG TPA: elongation factor Tu [Candidatus Angelobacter sp.]|nr:elongation factor Tu [Candidatus Angelobacter sp.]